MTKEVRPVDRIISLSERADISRLRREAVTVAREVGMSIIEQEAMRIVATELGTNVIKHAGSGMANVEQDSVNHVVTMLTRNQTDILSTDSLFKNGHSTAGTLGIGLGAVRRLCDEVELRIENGELVVRASKRRAEKMPSFIETSVLSRPLPGYEENGDGYYINVHDDSAILAVIDGLGHGPHAEEATLKAISLLINDDRAPLADIVQRMHRDLRHTRGCVIGITRIEPDGNMEYVGVGNIRAQIFSSSGEVKSLLSYSGVLGGNMRTLRIMSYHLPPDGTLVLYSDGIEHISIDRSLLARPVMEVAKHFFHENAKPTDDATLLVARMK